MIPAGRNVTGNELNFGISASFNVLQKCNLTETVCEVGGSLQISMGEELLKNTGTTLYTTIMGKTCGEDSCHTLLVVLRLEHVGKCFLFSTLLSLVFLGQIQYMILN